MGESEVEFSESPRQQHTRRSNTVSPAEFATAAIRVPLPWPLGTCLLLPYVVSRVRSSCSALHSLRFPDVPCTTTSLFREFIYVGVRFQHDGCVSVARNDGHASRVWCGRQKWQDGSAVYWRLPHHSQFTS